MNDLSNLLSSTTKESIHWRETSKASPILFASSLFGILFLYYFLTLNFQAIAAGLIAGISGSLGHLGIAIGSQRVQILSLVLLVVSVLVFPFAPKPSVGLLMLNGFIAGVGSFSIVFLLISLYLTLMNK